jgi:ribosomal protein S1
MVEIGTTISARVTRIEPYGVWLDHDGEKVLVLIPYFSWAPVQDLSQHVRVGQDLAVKVIRYNYQNRVIVGSRRALEPEKNPFRLLSFLDPGTPIEARVVLVNANDVTLELPNKVWGNLPRHRLPGEPKLEEVIQVVISALDVDEGRLTLDPAAKEHDSGAISEKILVPTT